MSSKVGKMEDSTSGHNVGVLGALVATVKYTYLTRYDIFTYHPSVPLTYHCLQESIWLLGR